MRQSGNHLYRTFKCFVRLVVGLVRGYFYIFQRRRSDTRNLFARKLSNPVLHMSNLAIKITSTCYKRCYKRWVSTNHSCSKIISQTLSKIIPLYPPLFLTDITPPPLSIIAYRHQAPLRPLLANHLTPHSLTSEAIPILVRLRKTTFFPYFFISDNIFH